MTIPFTRAWREGKRRKAALEAARTYVWSYDDVKDLSTLKAAIKAGDAEACTRELDVLDPPQSFAAAREWLDILVVSISVAMAFRAYFYEPFNIPTGSMQPTLYGNHSVTIDHEASTWVDNSPLRWAKWAYSGMMYEDFVAPCSGRLVFDRRNDGYYNMFVVNGENQREWLEAKGSSWPLRFLAEFSAPEGTPLNPMKIPSDVLTGLGGDAPIPGEPLMLPNGIRPDSIVKKGQRLWSGYVVTGDFLFVNRWIWNFRHPRRGDVMVFATTGIKGLQPGTHYIKRMTGTPGEAIRFKDGRLEAGSAKSVWKGSDKAGNAVFERVFVKESEPMSPERVAMIQNRESYLPGVEPEYGGYRPHCNPSFDVKGRTIAHEGDFVELGPDEYYACGDNSLNSFDSRYWGPVPAGNLRGAAGGVFWPFSHRWGTVE